MNDPAEEARVRASKAWKYHPNDPIGVDCAEAAAREALRPIKELHQPYTVCAPATVETWHECWTCHGTLWPCATARLVYSEEELS